MNDRSAGCPDLPDLPAIRELQAIPHWVAWKHVKRGGVWTKPPISPVTGSFAKHSDPKTWAPFDAALAFAKKNSLAGVGFVLTEQDGLTGIDIDACRNAETDALDDWAAEIVEYGETYAEVSPSGTGLRFIVAGKIDATIKCDLAHVEMYRSQRYLTITGRHLENTPTEIRPAPRTIAALKKRVERMRPNPPPARQDDIVRRQGDDFFRNVNTAALRNIAAWVTSVFGTAAVFQPGTQGYRVSSQSFGRNLEEDLSITPSGAVDFGIADMGDARQGRRTPIDLVMEYGGYARPDAAAMWLCSQLGVSAFSLGWRSNEDPSRQMPHTTERDQLASNLARPIIQATPYVWADPQSIPRREWLYGHHLIRKFVSATVAPGGVGKSSLLLAETIAMVSGKALLGILPPASLRVWLWNLEDPLEETTRRIQATAKHYHLTAEDLGDRLFVDSGRDQPLVIAETTRTGTVIIRPVIDAIIVQIRTRKIDVVIIDPFVSSHLVSENDNIAMDMVVKEWARVADLTNCAIELIHHTRKQGGTEAEITAESARGAKALTDACRSVRAINRMTKAEGDKAGVEKHRMFFRAFNDKTNLAPPLEKSDWFQLTSVDLCNGEIGQSDSVGVVATWKWPDPLSNVSVSDLRTVQAKISAKRWRENVQAKDWAGLVVAEVLKLDTDIAAHRAKIRGILKIWIANGGLTIVQGKDAKGNDRSFVEVGVWATD
jgi:hypothetical protein